MAVYYSSVKKEEVNTQTVSVSTEFVKKTIWTFTLKCIQALWSILLLLYGVVTLNTRPNIQIDRSENNGIHMEIKTDKRLRMYIVLHIPESMMLIYVSTKSGYSFDCKAMMRNQTINGSTAESLYGTNCANVPTSTRESPSIHHQQLKQSNDNQSNTTQAILRMNRDRETRRNIKRDEQNIDNKATFQPNKSSLNHSRLFNEHNTTTSNEDMTGKTAENENHLQQDTDISNCSKKISFGEDQKKTCRLYGKNEITDLDEIVKTNCANVPTSTRESPSIHRQQLKQSNDTIGNYNNEIKVENITAIANQSNKTQDILRMNRDRETRRNSKRDEQNIDNKATFQPNKSSLNHSRLFNEHNTTTSNEDMTGKTAANANHLQQDTDISNCLKKISFGEDQKKTCRLYGKNEITDLDEIVKDNDLILNEKLYTSMILSKDAQCVSKINQNKCEESFTKVDYNNKSQKNAVDINLKDNSLPGMHRKKKRLNRPRTLTRHNARQMTTKRVYIMVQGDIVRYMVLDFFSQKQWQERPHILWPSMHPLLLFKVIYLDENGNFL